MTFLQRRIRQIELEARAAFADHDSRGFELAQLALALRKMVTS